MQVPVPLWFADIFPDPFIQRGVIIFCQYVFVGQNLREVLNQDDEWAFCGGDDIFKQLFVDDSEEEPEGLEEEADVHQDVLALKAVLLDELEEEALDVGFGVLVVVLDINLELSVFFLLFWIFLVFDPGGNGQITIKLKFS